MKKGKITMAISLFLICILLMAVMFMQFKTIEETDIAAIESMRETELRKSISSWKEKYTDLEGQLSEVYNKITEYAESIETDKEASEVLEKELESSNMLVGKIDVQGEGVVITLNNQEDYVRGSDLLELVNELCYAGAEAISINGIRVTAMAEIVEITDGTMFVNGTRATAPFVVKAIGNQTYLSSSLTLKNVGFIDKYADNGIQVTLEKQKNVVVEKTKQEMKVKYLKEVEKQWLYW